MLKQWGMDFPMVLAFHARASNEWEKKAVGMDFDEMKCSKCLRIDIEWYQYWICMFIVNFHRFERMIFNEFYEKYIMG